MVVVVVGGGGGGGGGGVSSWDSKYNSSHFSNPNRRYFLFLI